MACNHCDNPVCLKGCPTRAYTKFAEYGAVLQDPDICFGCGYCTWVCPYNAPQLDTKAGMCPSATCVWIVSKWALSQRVHQPVWPAPWISELSRPNLRTVIRPRRGSPAFRLRDYPSEHPLSAGQQPAARDASHGFDADPL
ncbi:MAG: 4Fe-4S binding protein [Chromatiaceae bacterium]|nr:4Fe-4S binding protein [Chromatiaceae bacterium]